MGRAFEFRKARKLKRWGKMAKTFSRIGKDIVMAIKEGGPDPASNSRLRAVMQNAKAANMPKENVDRAIKKAKDKDTSNYKEVVFEGYGPHGVAVLVDKKGILSGVITDGDLRRNIIEILTFSPRDIATLNPISVKPADLVSVALEKMEKSKVYSIVVVEKHQPVGLLRMHDVLRAGIK